MKKSIIRLLAFCLALSMTVCVLGSCGLIGGTDSGNTDGGTNAGNNNNNNQNNNSNNNTNNNNNNAGNTDSPDKGEEEKLSEKGIFISSTAADGGDGTKETPYNSLSVISELTLEPGTYIYIEKGSEFTGSLAVKNAHGSEEEPIVITSYGKGSAPKIDGNNLSGNGVLYLANCSNIIVSGLELTDSATSEADRRGVLITCDNNLGTEEIVTYKNITLKDLYIHDIIGYRDATNSGMAMWSKITGGIHVWSNDGLGRIDGLVITECEITEVSNVGIATWYKVVQGEDGNVSAKMVSPYTDNFKDYAHLNVHIDGNEINHIGKNAIFARNLFGGLIEYNVVHDTAKYCVSGNSIVTRSVDGTVIQYNEGYRNLARGRDSDGVFQDGCMLDADLDSKYTVWQYNYSHDNSFGLFINCTTEEKDVAIVRYNLSVNDKGNKGIIYINYKSAGIYVYNNTIVTSYETEYIIQSNGTGRTSFFYNNLIYNRSDKAKFDINKNADMTAANNLVYNEYGSSIENLSYFKSINAGGIYDKEPMFVGYLQEDSILGINNLHDYKVESTSPALGVGTEVEAIPDFFGNSYKKSIGFYCGK